MNSKFSSRPDKQGEADKPWQILACMPASPHHGGVSNSFSQGQYGISQHQRDPRPQPWASAGLPRRGPLYSSVYATPAVAQIWHAGEYLDRLTGLANRCGTIKLLSTAIGRAVKECSTLALLLVDIDNFKLINDALGAYKGDALLKMVGRKLRAICPSIVVGRFAGDQFMLLVPAGLTPELVAERARMALRGTINIGGDSAELKASIGCCSFPADGCDAAMLVTNVETALYHAKANGRDRVCVFRPEMTFDVQRRSFLEAQLRRAVYSDALDLVYQPQFDCVTGNMISMEALVRWNHPEYGAISPAEFIPVAEKTALIVALGDWVAERACTQIAALNRQSGHPLPVAINVSARQFCDPTYPAQVATLLERTGLAPTFLELELTEGTLMQDVDCAVRTMTALRCLGVRLAIDDFGTGYSSLAYLRHFPINRLKIDRSFIATLPYDNQPLARALVALGHACGLDVLAEGVETQAQFDWLGENGCDAGQGFWLARPMCFGDLCTYIQGGEDG